MASIDEHQPNEAVPVLIPRSKDPQRVAAVKPIQRKMESHSSSDSNKKDNQSNMPIRCDRDYTEEDCDENLPKTAEVPLPPVMIEMLKICNFQDIYQTDSLKFLLNECDSIVVIRSSTDEETVQAQQHIYECLNSIKIIEERLTEQRLILLKREQSKNCLKIIFEKENIRASFVVNEARNMVEWYAFADADIEQCMKLLQSKIIVQRIPLRQGQEYVINGCAWNNLTKKIDIGTTSIYVDENSKTIIIESFSDTKAEEIKNRIIDFLKENVPKKRTLVTLEGAKARCFQIRLVERMKQEAEKHDGTFDIKEVTRSPLKLEIIVEGEEALTDKLNMLVHQICHESIDLGNISSEAEDKWLVLQGLEGPDGSKFMKSFEEQHSCFIEVSKRREVLIFKSKDTVSADAKEVKYDEMAEETIIPIIYPDSVNGDNANSFSRLEQGSGKEMPFFEQNYFLGKGIRRSEWDTSKKSSTDREFLKEQERLLQGAMNEDEAFKHAIANSLQDQTAHEERGTFQDEIKFDRQTEKPVLLNFDTDSDDAQVVNIFSRGEDVLGNEEERQLQFDYVESSNNCVDSDYGESDDILSRDDDVKENLYSNDCDKSSKSKMSEKHQTVMQKQRINTALLQGSMNEDEAIRQAIENSLQDQTTYEDKFVDHSGAYKLLEPKPPSFQYLMNQSVDVSDEAQKLPEPKLTSIQINHINVLLMQGKLAEQQTDVLVNVSSPTGSITESKVSQSIVNRGGDQLLQNYNDAISYCFGGISNVVSTKASGKLRCKTVLHVRLEPGPHNCQQVLGQVLSEILDECNSNGYCSLALPPLGVGRIYNYPAKVVAQQILQTIFMYQQEGYNKSLRHVTVVIFNDDHKTYHEFDDAFTSFNTNGIHKFISEPLSPYLLEQSSLQRNREGFHKVLCAPLNQDKRQTTKRSYSPARSQHPPSYQGAVAMASSGASYKKQQQLKSVTKKHYSRSSPADDHSLHPGRHSSHREMFKYSRYPHKSSERETSMGKCKEDLRGDQPVEHLKVEVFSDNSDLCVQARNLLENEIKKKFLYEDKIPNTQNISREAKKMIKEIIFKHCIKSYKDGYGYLLKGNKENVVEARGEILFVLLKEKESQEMKGCGQANFRRGTKDFAKLMQEDKPHIPSYWNMDRPELLSKIEKFVTRKKYKKVSLPEDSLPFSAIIKMVNATFDPRKLGEGRDAVGLKQLNYSKLFITEIKRIENPELYENFARQKRVLFRKLTAAGEGRYPKVSDLPRCKGAVLTEAYARGALDEDTHSELNEVFLFHGTNEKKVDTICNDGFDNRLGDENGMYGLGIYGAECSMKADQYADDKDARTGGKGQKKKMFLVRMLLGNAFLCNYRNPRKYRRPPCTRSTCLKYECSNTGHVGKFGHFFDSIIGDNGKMFREFVVYDSNMCYPEYLITYERR